MASTYGYINPCVVQDPSSPSSVIVAGVNEATGDTLEVTRVDITDISNPKPTRFLNHTDVQRWSPATEKICVLYPNEVWESGVPIFYIRQFNSKGYSADIMVNGSIALTPNSKIDLVTTKLYSFTGASRDREWVTTVSKQVGTTTGSPWLVVTKKGTKGFFDHNIQRYPPADALLSVGTYSFSTESLVPGYLTVFDATGSKGWLYKVTSSDVDNAEQWLQEPDTVEMNGIVLTQDAISNTMKTTGYIIDKAPDDSTILYSISPTPGSQAKLLPVSVDGNVPRFMRNRVSTIMDSNKLLLFGGLQDAKGSTVFHYFDTATLRWNGPDLVPPYVPESPSSPSPPAAKTSNVAAVAGGAVGGVVVLLLALFFVFRWRRLRHHKVVVRNPETDQDKSTVQPAFMAESPHIHQYPQPHNPHFPPVIQQPIAYAYPAEELMQARVVQPQEPAMSFQPVPAFDPEHTYRSPQDRLSKMHLYSPTHAQEYSASPTLSTPAFSSPGFVEDRSALSPSDNAHSSATLVPPKETRPPGNPQYHPQMRHPSGRRT